jgi:hypothetical protein
LQNNAQGIFHIRWDLMKICKNSLRFRFLDGFSSRRLSPTDFNHWVPFATKVFLRWAIASDSAPPADFGYADRWNFAILFLNLRGHLILFMEFPERPWVLTPGDGFGNPVISGLMRNLKREAFRGTPRESFEPRRFDRHPLYGGCAN